ncbi:MAG: sulfurtransferase [Dehalococcoidia bacterium]|nr:sulfurtransferase [Dehalococcoidia bacterium]|tara:strand:- start:602 stop:973 length:372 start_codon:yes stop_codon:yes gene_type:complete
MKDHAKGFLSLVEEALKDVPEIDVFQVKSRLDKGDKIILIDVREDNEWSQGRIPTSLHFGKGIIERDIESNIEDRNTELILYCQGGFRSALAAKSLSKMGYKNVNSMNGGYSAWVTNEFPISQ